MYVCSSIYYFVVVFIYISFWCNVWYLFFYGIFIPVVAAKVTKDPIQDQRQAFEWSLSLVSRRWRDTKQHTNKMFTCILQTNTHQDTHSSFLSFWGLFLWMWIISQTCLIFLPATEIICAAIQWDIKDVTWRRFVYRHFMLMTARRGHKVHNVNLVFGSDCDGNVQHIISKRIDP